MKADGRELLRRKGQFWTPQWVARPMARHAMPTSGELLDPAFGMGAFLDAFMGLGGDANGVRFVAGEVDIQVLHEFRRRNPSAAGCDAELRDFILDPPSRRFAGIVANPPYVRHHRLSPEMKSAGRRLCVEAMGKPIDARAGLHVYFLIQSLLLLKEDSRLAIILPSDAFEGVFARPLWGWIASRYRIDCIATFAPEATPFNGIDINPVVAFLRKADPRDSFCWAKVMSPSGSALDELVASGFAETHGPCLSASLRPLTEALGTGLSRNPSGRVEARFVLGDFASVKRGIVSGANGFFLITREQARRRAIPRTVLLPAVARVRDVQGDVLDSAGLDRLDAGGRPTLLFSPSGRHVDDLSESARNYLTEGERGGVPKGAICSSRKPWYRMEQRQAPPILFAYLGRRHCRFVRNLAGAVPLNGFLCVYPRSDAQGFVDALWRVLSDARTAANLWLVGKSYGNGAVKVEPRALERLPLPDESVDEAGLSEALTQSRDA